MRTAHCKVRAFSERSLHKQLEFPLLDWFLACLAFGPRGFGELKQGDGEQGIDDRKDDDTKECQKLPKTIPNIGRSEDQVVRATIRFSISKLLYFYLDVATKRI